MSVVYRPTLAELAEQTLLRLAAERRARERPDLQVDRPARTVIGLPGLTGVTFWNAVRVRGPPPALGMQPMYGW